MNTWAEVMKAIGALEDRVKKLEAEHSEKLRRTRYLDENGAIVDRTAPTLTETGRILVDPDEYARLERVERAACQIVSQLDETRKEAFGDSYAVVISGMFDRLVLGGLRKDLKR